ncbi:hypothetical protein EG327_001646 [Venturia inaequalis]|uniref:Chromo domain-containing protein n=1 Tax=Venturia inaequalis TaxID=5025 RepID=A0A8H3ZBL3_VENIN|nr:hypothetical protein EG327_001646 [Venturia inaequalis]
MRMQDPRKRPPGNSSSRPSSRIEAIPRAGPVEDALDNPLYRTTIADMERYLRDNADVPAHSSHTGSGSGRQRLSGNGMKRSGKDEAVEAFDGSDGALAGNGEELANEEAAKAWGEEKMKRQKGLLGVPAADARIGALPESSRRVGGKRKATEDEDKTEDDDTDRKWLDIDGKDTSLLVDGEQQWEVEAIIDAKLMKHKTRKYEPADVCYKVTYKGNWPLWNVNPPWQCKEDLLHCAELVRKFHQDNPKKPGAHRANTFRQEAIGARKEQGASKETTKTTVVAPGKMDRAAESAAWNKETPEQSEIIAISSDPSSSSDSLDTIEPVLNFGPKRRGPRLIKGPHTPTRPRPAEFRRSPLNITLAPGAPLQALGPMGLLGGRPNGNGKIAQSRPMLDEFGSHDGPEQRKRKMDEVVGSKMRTDSEKQDSSRKRKAGKLVRPKKKKKTKS